MNLFAPKFKRTRFPALRRVLWDGVLIELEDAEKQTFEPEGGSYTDYLQGLRGVGEVFDRHSGGGGGCE